jgi:hypothetical protein
MRHGTVTRNWGFGGQLPRRVSGGICGVAAEHAKSEETRLKGSKGEKKKKKDQRGREWGEENANGRKREISPPSVM